MCIADLANYDEHGNWKIYSPATIKEKDMHLHPLRDALAKMSEPETQAKLTDMASKLTPEEAAAVHSGNAEVIKKAAAAAPGGFLAAILAMLGGLVSNPAIMQLLLTILGQLIPIPKKP